MGNQQDYIESGGFSQYLYKDLDRKNVLDFDWGHTHTNTSDGRIFTKGTIHVQEYSVDSNGKLIRHSDSARLMTDTEIKKYGPLIKAYNTNVRFR